MSKRMRMFVDGYGSDRIVEELKNVEHERRG